MNSYALVVDDHPLVCRSLCGFLRALAVTPHTIGAGNAAEVHDVLVRHGTPALVLMDYWLGTEGSQALLAQLVRLSPSPRVLVLSGGDPCAISPKAKAGGAHGFVGKGDDPSRLSEAVHAVLRGDTWFPLDQDTSQGDTPNRYAAGRLDGTVSVHALGLSEQQGQVLALILEGQPNRQIAARLDLSDDDVKQQIRIVLQQLGVSHRLDAITKLAGCQLIR